MALIDKLKAIGDAIRGRTGTTGKLSLDEMAEMIDSMEVGSDDVSTYLLIDENGVEYPAVLVDEPVTLTANPVTDIRKGTTAVTEAGVVTGEKEIPAYNTTEGAKVVPNGSVCQFYVRDHGYTKLQAILCQFNTSMSNSMAAEKVVMNDNVYPVQSTVPESSVSIDDDTKIVNLGITNMTGKPCIIRYFSYKEIY